ncbi:MAG: hypothetical protein EBT80_00645 [Chitinophagales bacterium]|nr:hypothetical protein [Chitinophagales bacterium]
MATVKPELNLIGRDDVQNGDRWVVRETKPVRGLPKTNIDDREMHVPLGDNDKSRAIRAHEMIHAKISPNTDDFKGWVTRGVASERALIIAEESRVNYIAHMLGFPVKTALSDGREMLDAIDAAQSQDWAALVAGAVASTFTEGQDSWVVGALQVDVNMGAQLERVVQEVTRYWYDCAPSKDSLQQISAIAILDDHIQEKNNRVISGEHDARDNYNEPVYCSGNLGFSYTEQLAQRIDVWSSAGDLVSISSPGDNVIKGIETDAENGLNTKPTWDTLRWGPMKPMRSVPGAVSRKRTAMNSGKYPRRIERLLSDPERRIFDHVKKSKGGVVLIDGSGSMEFEAEDIEQMVLAAPGCTVAVYSAPDDPACYGTSWPAHTIHLLAENGKTLSRSQIADVKGDLCGGNGCDLPALKWAMSQRTSNKQPLIWVTDGNIHGSPVETVRVAKLARSADVMYAANGHEAAELMRKLKSRSRVKTRLPYGFREALSIVFSSSSGTSLDPRV